MTNSTAQRFVAGLASQRRAGESDLELVRRWERRHRLFVSLAALPAGFGFMSLASGVQPPLMVFLLVVVGLGSQAYLWLSARSVRRFLDHPREAA